MSTRSTVATSKRPASKSWGRTRRFAIVWALRIGVVAVCVGVWELLIRTGYANELLVGSPLGTLQAFAHQFTTTLITIDLPYTLFEVFIGFAISVASGFIAGIILSLNESLRNAVAPLITAANSLPRIALAPLFILWFGLGATGKIALVVSFVFFVMLTTTVAGFTQPNGDFKLLAASLGVNTRQEVLLFVLPGAIPTLMAGVELSLIYSFLAAVSGELVGGSHGLGVQLVTFANNFHIDEFMAVLLLLVIVATVPVQLLRFAVAPLIRWHKAELGENM